MSRQSDLKTYFTLVATLGTGYQRDPQFRRIADAMQEAPTPEDALQTLSEGVKEFQAKVRGNNDEWYHAALQRVLRTPYDTWHRPNFAIDAAAMLTALYPERAAYAGEQALIDLVSIARKEAEKWALPPQPGICILTGLMFFLGAGCMADPLHPWIAKKLHEDISPVRKALELFDLGRRLAQMELFHF